MKEYMMDSNASSQSRWTSLYACHFESPTGEEKSVTTEAVCNRFLSSFGMTLKGKFSFARGTPVVANRQPGISYPVIPFLSCHSEGQRTEESFQLKQISPPINRSRNDRKEKPVRDRPLFMLRDGPSWLNRGAPRWLARGKPPAWGEPMEYGNVMMT